MNNLHNYLPKDLVNIVEEYAKDRTKYDHVIWSFKYKKQHAMIGILNHLVLPQYNFSDWKMMQDIIDTELHWSKLFVRRMLS